MTETVKNVIIKNEELIREQDWKQLWLKCAYTQGFYAEEFKELEFMLDSIGVYYEDGKQEAALHILQKIVKQHTHFSYAYISSICSNATLITQMGYSTEDICDMFHKYKTELNIKGITSKLLLFN